MIISRTPFRISFFGGGTDYPLWFKRHGGSVLATAIDKYAYITCRRLPKFFSHRSRVVYSRIEMVERHEQIEHPSARAVLEYLNCEPGFEIHYDGDLPARAGMGSSSSFTVGLLNALSRFQSPPALGMGPYQLADAAILVEQDRLQEFVGSQDQISAAYGGFNCIRFNANGTFQVEPVRLASDREKAFRERLLLFYTGSARTSNHEVARSKVERLIENSEIVHQIGAQVDEAVQILTEGNIDDFGPLLDEGWRLKKMLSSQVSTSLIDEYYDVAKKAGATGGKILGAGGGGFLLFFTPPEHKKEIRNRLKHLVEVPFQFEPTGSQIVFNDEREREFS